ncbi:MAG: hypothetical protein QG608_1532 [Actinomycetota bacterium]|nr:hypothetical protein [Actinomycetota bacterium]
MTAPADGPHRPQATTPHHLTLTDTQFQTLGEAVRRSPSIGNTQPWRLRRLPDGLTILEDTARDLPGTDPAGRERTISCGTAILNARIAMCGLSLRPRVELCPEPHNKRVLASVRATETSPPAREDLELLRMIPRRHTHHRVYRSHAIAEEDLFALRESVTAEGARLTVADSPARRHLAELLPPTRPCESTGNRTRKELARSTILIISTAGDTRHDWIVAGLALERLLLTAGLKGLVAAFGEQHLQDNTMRPRVAEALQIWGIPQALLRIGRALVDPPKTPRRPLSELLEP